MQALALTLRGINAYTLQRVQNRKPLLKVHQEKSHLGMTHSSDVTVYFVAAYKESSLWMPCVFDQGPLAAKVLYAFLCLGSSVCNKSSG